MSSLLSGNLISETSSRIDGDKILFDAILSNKAEIDDLWKNIRGGLNYIDNLSVAAAGYDTVNHAFVLNKSDGVTVPDFLREGFFWTIKTIDKNAHYFIEGLEVEHGDWFIMKNNTPLSDVTSADIAVFDAQDFDNFKLSGNNNVVGNNTFTGRTTFKSGIVKFEDDVDFVGGEKNIVVEGNLAISGVTSVKDLVVSENAIVERNTLVSGDVEVAGKTKLLGILDISGNTTASSISVDALSAAKFESVSSEINHLSAKDAILADVSVENASVENAIV